MRVDRVKAGAPRDGGGDEPDDKAGLASDVLPRQSNYHRYSLPDGVVVTDKTPLYQVVALWGWQRQRPFSRDDVAKAFGIDQRRAGDVMSYIRRVRADVVNSRQYYERLECGVRQRMMQILAEPALDGRPYYEPAEGKLSDVQKGVAVQELRRWFLYRKNRT
ncbi:CaiF/GrlA family transcriptional regulator (plasmid) [Serratia nevei]|uniref:CaiF/GrlA family transcriptional regulator n=1 Tax=Serratia nevei TaxID=2703794 RepID=UPI003F6B434D